MQSPLVEQSISRGEVGMSQTYSGTTTTTDSDADSKIRRRRYHIERLSHWISRLLSVDSGRWQPINGFERVFFCDRAVSRAFAYAEDELQNPGILFPSELNWLAEMEWLKIAYEDNDVHGACCLFMFYLDGTPFAMAFHLDPYIYQRLCDINPRYLTLGLNDESDNGNANAIRLVPIERGLIHTAAAVNRG